MTTHIYNISGMSCAACSASVNRVVSRLKGVASCEVNLITGKMTVTFDEAKTGEADFVRVVEKAGFGIERESLKNEEKKEESRPLLMPIIFSAIFSGLLLILSMGTMLFPDMWVPEIIDPGINPYNFAITQLLLCVPALYYGRRFFIKGIPLLLKGHPNMDSLVAVGALASLAYSGVMTYLIARNPHAIHNLYYESVAVVITLVMLGKTLEEKSRGKTLDAIKGLMELKSPTAVVLRENKEITLPIEKIAVGDILVVKSGFKIPLDGVITKGQTSVDESMLTGEAMPVYKGEGSSVTGGSLNLTGLIYIKVSRIGEDTTLARIIKFVEEAGSKKAPISKTADRVAGVFVPVVMAVAVLSAAGWLIAKGDVSFALKIFTSVLVVACPCSLGLATPTAIIVGTGVGAKNGILIRNGEVLETTHKINVAVFDKTGTLTSGKPQVDFVRSEDEAKLLELSASAEKGSDHPLARAICSYAEKLKVATVSIEDFQNLAGKGVACKIGNKDVLVGTSDLLSEHGILINDLEIAREEAQKGKSLVFVAEEGVYLGFLSISDTVKPGSKAAFQKLKAMGIKTVILSGDNELSARYIGDTLGADEVYSQVLPTGKAEALEKIRQSHGTVLMVGDGINDAPALTKADVGVAIGNGSDIAIESADIVLMKSDPSDVVRAINLSRKTIKNIKQNLFWAFCYNTVCIPIACGVLYPFTGLLLSPMLAGLAMSLSSVFVVGNALRLKFKKI